MGKEKNDSKNEKEAGLKGHIEIELDSDEKVEVLEAFMSSYKAISNEELRKRLKLEDDEEESAPPFL